MYSGAWPLRAFVVAAYVFLLLPLVLIAASSFSASDQFQVFGAALSWRWYRSFFASAAYLQAMFGRSLPIALIAAVIATAVGGLASVAVAASGRRTRGVLEPLLMLPLIVPTVLLGIGLYLAALVVGFKNGFVLLVLGHSLIAAPYVIRIVVAALDNADAAVEEAARSLGCNRIQAFLHGVLPQIKSSLVAAFIFSFIESFSDINLALFIAGPGNTTIPVQIYSDIVWQGDPTISAASTIQMVVVCALVFTAYRFAGRKVRI